MHLYAASLGLGSCLMDSVRIAFRASGSLRTSFGIARGERVLGALLVGYPEERTLNLIEGLSLELAWNPVRSR